MPPCGQPPTTTHIHDPPPRYAHRHPHLLPPNAERGGWGGALQDQRRAGGKGAPQEGHDFPRLGEGAPAAFRGGGPAHAEGCERGGGGEGAFLGDREPPRPARLPPPDRPSEPRSWLPSPCPAARGTSGCGPGPRSRSSLPAATGVCAGPPAPGPASGGGGRAAPYSHPPGLSPPPATASAAAAAAAGALCCNARAAAAEPARAPVAPVTATPPGAARRAAEHILSPAPSPGAAPPAQPRRGSAEAGGCVAAVTRYAGPPPGTRVAEGGREVRQPSGSGGGAAAWSLASGPLPGSSLGSHSHRSGLGLGGRVSCLPTCHPRDHGLSPSGSQLCTAALLSSPMTPFPAKSGRPRKPKLP